MGGSLLEDLSWWRARHEGLPEKLAQYLEVRLARYRLPKSFQIMGRLKGLEDAYRKLGRKGYEAAEQVADICGVRLITYPERDVDAYVSALLDLLPEAEVTRKAAAAPESFWYRTVHVDGAFTAQLAADVGRPDAEGLPYEIQVRSILEHAWAEVEHELSYHSEVDPPPRVRRKFAALAALLEIGDTLLDEVVADASSYQRQLGEEAGAADAPIDINVDSLEWALRSAPAISELDEKMAQDRSVTVSKIDRSTLGQIVQNWKSARITDLRLALNDIHGSHCFREFLDVYNRRNRVRDRPVNAGESLYLFAHFTVLRRNPDELRAYLHEAHPGWSEASLSEIVRRLHEEVWAHVHCT